MPSKASDYQQRIIDEIYLAQQVDDLHLSLINLLEMVDEEELELVLEQPKKSSKQKDAYLTKVIDQLPSKELAEALTEAHKKEGLDFFGKHSFAAWIKQLQRLAETIQVVKVTFALEFKEKDLRQIALEFSQRSGKKTAFDISIDKRMLGGLIIQYGNYITDYSLRARIDQFRSTWHKAVLDKKS